LVVNKVFGRVAFLMAFAVMASLAGASIPAFTVDAPTQAYAGEPITVAVHVSHPDQNGLHYVYDIKLYVNNELTKEWTYDKTSYVKNGLWDESAEVTLTGDSEIYVTGCSTPGSIGFGCSAKTEKTLAHVTVTQKPAETVVPTQAATVTAPEITRPTPTLVPIAPQKTDNTLLWVAIGAIILIAIIAFAFYAMKKKPEKHAAHPAHHKK